MVMRELKSIAIAMALLGAHSGAFSQGLNLPSAMYVSQDGHYLRTGGLASEGLYDSTLIRDFYLEFPQANYWSQMQANYTTRTPIPAALTVDGVSYDSVGVAFKGNTSYMNVQNSNKKSFGIDMNEYISGQDLMGYSTLNLNNSFEDESFLREVFYSNQIRHHVPAVKANFIHLHINGGDWGLYPNVQQLNKDMMKEWFFSNDGSLWRAHVRSTGGPGPGPGPGGQWGDGTAAFNYLGSDTALYQDYYTLKSSDEVNPWDYLRDACQMLNQTATANLESVLPQYFDMDRVLWFLACEIAFADDDSYVYKGKMDYYAYHDVETGRMTPLEFDGNSALNSQGLNWSPFYHADNANYPLLNKVLAVPAWRQRYLAHMRTILNGIFNPANTNGILDAYKAQIDQQVQDDPIKLYTYNEFVSEVTALKTFITNRRTILLANTEVAQVAPTISNPYYQNTAESQWTAPAANEQGWVRADVTHTSGVFQVNLYYSDAFTGNFSVTQMYDDGAHHDGAAADGVYGGAIPGYAAGTWVRSYVEAVANTTAKSVAYWPVGAEHDVFVYQVQLEEALNIPVVINEVMASNSATASDDAGEYDDWVELYNNGSSQVDLSGYYLTDNLANLNKWQVPANTVIAAGGYMILWADEDSSQGWNHMNFKLSASGEAVMLLDDQLRFIDSLHYGAQTTDMGLARVPNGTGDFMIQLPTYNGNNDNVSVGHVVKEQSVVRVYPNPARDFVQIMASQQDDMAIEVFDAVGKKMLTANVNGMLRIDTGEWPSGVYMLRATDVVHRIIITH
jgi:hypothetical protein